MVCKIMTLFIYSSFRNARTVDVRFQSPDGYLSLFQRCRRRCSVSSYWLSRTAPHSLARSSFCSSSSDSSRNIRRRRRPRSATSFSCCTERLASRSVLPSSRQHLTHQFISADAIYGCNSATKRPVFYFDCSALSRTRVVIMT